MSQGLVAIERGISNTRLVTVVEGRSRLIRKTNFLPLSQGGRNIRGFVLSIAINVNTDA